LKEREARKGLDFGKNCDSKAATFFFQIQEKNYKLHQVVSLGLSNLRYEIIGQKIPNSKP
jgi:hypothetical protein